MELTTDQIISSFDIVEYIGEYTDLKKQGSTIKGVCPIHGEKTPSLYVYEHNQSFYCFGCGAGGTVVDFVKDYMDVSLGDAFRMLRDRLGNPTTSGMTEIKVRLTPKGEQARLMAHEASYERPYFFDEYGLVVGIHQVYEGLAFAVLSNNGKPVDFIMENDFRSGKNTEQGILKLGDYSQSVIITPDYIDALYLRQQVPSSTMVVFCGCNKHMQNAIDECKKLGCDDVKLAIPAFYNAIDAAELCDAPYITPADAGFWCSKYQKQAVNL